MRRSRFWVLELATALALVGVVSLYSKALRDPLRAEPATTAVLALVYALIAVGSQAMLAAALRPAAREVLSSNVLIAAVVSGVSWGSVGSASWAIVVGVATAGLRLLVGTMSLHVSRNAVTRFTCALVGFPLSFAVLIEGYLQSVGFYQEHYVWPARKFGLAPPLPTHDVVFLIAFWTIALAALYVSWRLLKYAFLRKPARVM